MVNIKVTPDLIFNDENKVRIKKWIEGIMEQKLPDDIIEAFGTGAVLCEYVTSSLFAALMGHTVTHLHFLFVYSAIYFVIWNRYSLL